MSVEKIREALSGSPSFWDRLHRSLDAIGFTQSYAEGLVPVALPGRVKYFKDSVWGMMEFTPDELAIIDCPLLQRLRRIHQLGFTFLTYPSAEHTRFSHTLGVTHVVKRLISSIAEVARQNTNLRAAGEEYAFYDPTKESEKITIRSLVHAALLHDCGHLAFSHAGEAAFAANAGVTKVGGMDLDDFLQVFREASFGSELSECLSIAFCLSPRFQSFYSKIVGPTQIDKRTNDVCSFIGGVPHHRAYPGLANIISGAAVDADKIDYINRDAKECGIPVGVDVSRVFLNTALININEVQARKLSRAAKPEDAERFVPGWHFIVNSTGVDTYDELANARTILYNRVYLHQLTRNAEQVFAAAIRRAMSAAPPPEGPAPSDALSWVPFGDFELLHALAERPESAALGTCLIARRLPKRAFVLFRDVCEPFVSLQDVFDSREWIGSNLDGYLEELDTGYARQTAWKLFDQIIPTDPDEAPRRVSELRTKVRDEAIAARKALDQTFNAATLKGDDPYVGFAPRYKQKPVPEVLVREKNAIGFSYQWSTSDELTSASSVARGLDYFYADQEWLMYVAMACVKVLFDFHATRLTSALTDEGASDATYDQATFAILPRLKIRLENVCSRIGLDYSDLARAMNRAAMRGYFGRTERVVPLDENLQRRCRSIANQYDQLLGERGWRVTEESVESFVRQFPVALREKVFDLLANGKMLRRADTRNAIDGITHRLHADSQKALLICRFSPNSGNFVGMILEQERRDEYLAHGHRFVRNLAELELELNRTTDVCVVFVDDQFATGGQAHAQILQWAGVERGQWPEEIRTEQNIDSSILGPKAREVFSTGRVILAFVFGTADGKKRIKQAASSVGFNGLDVQYASQLNPEDRAIPDDLKSFLADVGFQLLKRVRFGDSEITSTQEGVLRTDALGYGGHCSVIVTPFGSPSHTITALWCPGVFQEQPWVPLFLRRGYRKHLVFG